MSETNTEDYLRFEVDLENPETVSAVEELSLWSATFGLLLLKHVPMRPNMRVLDVGCGTGFPLLELAQRLGPTCTVCALDPWAAALQRAREKATIRDVRNVEIIDGDAAAMPFDDGEFDLIVSNLGINNFEAPEAVMKECRRVMKPSARIALSTNLRGHMQEFYDVFESTLTDLGKTEMMDGFKHNVGHRMTVEQVHGLFEKTGFDVTAIHRENAVMRFVDGSALLRHYFIKLGFLEGWRDVVDAGDRAEVFATLEDNLNRAAHGRGELLLTIPMAYIEGKK